MVEIFNFIGGLFGYILWGAFMLVKNFGLAIIIFSLIVKLLIYPFSVKQQKSMAANARFQQKQQEIMQKYANDRNKANLEVQKLMAQENVSPLSGCWPMLLPMIVMFGIYYSVINPLTNTLHIAGDKVTYALNSLSTLPGMGVSMNTQYGQISIVKYFNQIQPYLNDSSGNPIFTAEEASRINEFSNGFNFCGLDLLATPGASSFESMMWLIPVLCFITYLGSMVLTQKMNGTKMQGCMKVMVVGMPLFSASITYSIPGAVGFYWITSTVLGFIQSCVMNKFYNMNIIEAKAEAQRVVLRRQQEAKLSFIEGAIQVFDEPLQRESAGGNSKAKENRKSSGKNNKKKSGSNTKSNYQGKKK